MINVRNIFYRKREPHCMFCKQSESWEIATNYYCEIRVKSLQIFLYIALMAFFLHKFAISFPNKICKKGRTKIKVYSIYVFSDPRCKEHSAPIQI